MIDNQVVNILQPDVCYMGGVTRTLEVSELAQQANLPVTLHSANLSLVTLFSAHIMGAIPNAGKYLEFSIEGLDYYPWQANIFSPNFEIVKGQLIIDHQPGWGVELNPEWLSQAQYQASYTGSRF